MKYKTLPPIGFVALAASLALPAMAKTPHSISITPVGSIAAGSVLVQISQFPEPVLTGHLQVVGVRF